MRSTPNSTLDMTADTPNASAPASGSASANLDFLRTFAVSIVVLRHLLGAFNVHDSGLFHLQAFGIFGVLLFFVHTCLVLMFSLERQHSRYGRRHFFGTFMVRRCFRIYPLSIVTVGLIAIAGAFVPAIYSPTSGFATALDAAGVTFNLLLVQNLMHAHDIFGVLWSLPLEMQMYIFLPALFLIAGRVKTSGLLCLWGLSAAVAVIQPKLKFLPDILRFVPCFLPGIICYTLWNKPRALPFWMMPATLVLCLFAYEVAYGRLHSQTAAGIPLCLIVGLVLPRFRELESRLGRSICETIARYSYGIYLTHLPMIWLAFVGLRAWSTAAQWAVFLAGLIVLPLIAYHTVEEPMIRAGGQMTGKLFHNRVAKNKAVLAAEEPAP